MSQMQAVWTQLKGGQYPGAFWLTVIAATAVGLAMTVLLERGLVVLGLGVSLLVLPIMVSYIAPTVSTNVNLASKVARLLAWFVVSMVLFGLLNGMRTA